jgi:hypothetical protein
MNKEDPAIRLMLGYLCVANEAEASLVRKVEILDRFSLSDAEIAIICGVAHQSVRNARLTLKKSSKSNVKQK